MDIWVLLLHVCFFLYDDRRDTVVLSSGKGGGRSCRPPCKKSMRGSFEFKNQCHFQYDTTKVYQLPRLFLQS